MNLLSWLSPIHIIFLFTMNPSYCFTYLLSPVLFVGLKKKQLHVDKPDDDLVVNAYDDIDDYDFMWAAITIDWMEI